MRKGELYFLKFKWEEMTLNVGELGDGEQDACQRL